LSAAFSAQLSSPGSNAGGTTAVRRPQKPDGFFSSPPRISRGGDFGYNTTPVFFTKKTAVFMGKNRNIKVTLIKYNKITDNKYITYSSDSSI